MFSSYLKKTLAFLLTAMMVLSVMPLQVLAAEEASDAPVFDCANGIHDWQEGAVLTDPLCETEGEREYMCSICLDGKTEPIPALGHDVVLHEGKKPTYTTPGYEPYETCKRCDEYNTYTPIPALGEAEINDFDEFIENN